jgi:hypothetical protein
MTPWGEPISPVGERPRGTVLLRSCAVAIEDLDQTGVFRAVHALALRGSLPELAANLRCAFDPAVESIATVWRELREDYLQTLRYAQEAESI